LKIILSLLFVTLVYTPDSHAQNKITRIDFSLGEVTPFSMRHLPPMYTNSHPGDLIVLLGRITRENPAVALAMMDSWYVPNPILNFISFQRDDGAGQWSADITTKDGYSGTVHGKPKEGAVTFRQWLIQNGFAGVGEFYDYLIVETHGKQATLAEIETAGRVVGRSGGFTTDAGEANSRVDGLNNGTAPIMGKSEEHTFALLVPKPPPPPEPPAVAKVVAPAEVVDYRIPEYTRWQRFTRACRLIFLGD
jgi:hypothetical protein